MFDKIIQKIKDLIPKKGNPEPVKKEETPSAAPQTNALSEEEAKKKKKSLIIKVVVGVLLLYFVADEILKEKEPQVPSKPTTARAKKKDSARVPKKALKDNVKPETKVAKPTPEKVPDAKVTQRSVSSVPPQEPEKKETETPSPEESPKMEETVKLEEAPKVEEELAIDEPTPSPEVATEERIVEEPIPLEAPTEEISGEMEKIAEEVGPISEEEEIQPAENVSLPDYTIRGRGLVYNCKEKHWACIDKTGYFSCRSHMQWSKENKKQADCAIKNVYSTEDECSTVQLHYINTNEPTEFCN